MLAFPSILLAMAITAALGLDSHAMLAMILVWWPEFARLMRGQVLATKQNDYVTSARALGGETWRVLGVHVIPNAFPRSWSRRPSTLGTRWSSSPLFRFSALVRCRPSRSGGR